MPEPRFRMLQVGQFTAGTTLTIGLDRDSLVFPPTSIASVVFSVTYKALV
jgi:hypothetical protein